MTHTQPVTNRMFPGMGDSFTEFFITIKETPSLNIIQNGKILPFSDISFSTMKILDEAIHQDKKVNLELHDMHPTSKMKRIEQFAICRFGGLDFTGDIEEGRLQNGEYWDCPLHGSCKSEGILCKLPTYNEQRLSTQEVQLLKLLTTDKTNEAIAEETKMAMGSFHKAKRILYNKLGIQTKQEATKIAYLLNLIQL